MKPKPLGFATYEKSFEASRAMRILNGFQIGSKKLSVKVDPATRSRIEKNVPPPSEAVLLQDQESESACQNVVERIAAAKQAAKQEEEAAKNVASSSSFMESMNEGDEAPAGLVAPPPLPTAQGAPSEAPPPGPPPGPPPPGPPPLGPPPTKKEPQEHKSDATRAEDRRRELQDQDYRSERRKWESIEHRRLRDLDDDEDRKRRRVEDAAKFVKRQRELEAKYDDDGDDGDARYYRTKFINELKSNWRYEQRWMTADRDKQVEEERKAAETKQKEVGAGLTSSLLGTSQTMNAEPQPLRIGVRGQSQGGQSVQKTINTVFNPEDDEETAVVKKRKLVKIAYTDEQLRAVGLDPDQERKKQVEEIIASIPAEKEQLFLHPVQWDVVDNGLVDTRLRPWVDKQITEFVGGPEPSLVQFICDKVAKRCKPAALLADVEGVLDEEAEMFVKKLWRRVIYEAEYKKQGLQTR